MNRTEFVPQTKFSTAASVAVANQSAPVVGDCYRLKVVREGSVAHHLVLILVSEGEWCTVLDLQPAYGQPNPTAGERLRWTNPHCQFLPVPIAEWPLAARRCRTTGGFSLRTRAAGTSARPSASHSAASTRRQIREDHPHRATVAPQRTMRRPRTSEMATPGYETVIVQS